MRKLILQLAVSLDGFIEGPNGEYDWCFTDQDYGQSEFFKRIDTVFYGRKTYEMMLGMADQNESWLPKLREYIFSNTIDKLKAGAILVKGNIKEQVRTIKQTGGRDIWLFGGAGLTASLMNLGLVDEISLAIHPILLGSGKPLLHDIQDRVKLKLMDTKSFSSGLVSLTYQVLPGRISQIHIDEQKLN